MKCYKKWWDVNLPGCVCLGTSFHIRPKPPCSIPHLGMQRVETYKDACLLTTSPVLSHGDSVEAALLILSLSTVWTRVEPWIDGWRIWCLEPQLWKKHELYVEVSGQPHICLFVFFYSQKGSRTSGFGSIVVGTLAMRSLQSREQKEHRIGCLSP